MKELAKGYCDFDIDMCVYVCDFAFLFTTFGYYYCLLCFWFRYRPSLPVSYISGVLAFTDDAECLDFLVSMEAVILEGASAVDCKLTHSKLTISSN